MTPLIMGMILVSALMHATWNLLAKRVATGAVFVWLFDGVAIVVCAPVALAIVATQGFPLQIAACALILATATLHLTYFIVLNRGYRHGDLSLVYPVARGSGPLLATIAAIAFLGERPTPIALAGALLVVGGAVALTGNVRAVFRSGMGHGLLYALLTGCLIAGYTINDKEAVSAVHINPLVYFWCGTVLGWTFLTPWVMTRRAEARTAWAAHWRETIGVGVLSSVAYVLVLTALVYSPVSYVAPMREIGVLFGVIMGTRLLGERDARRRLGAAAGMVVGIVCLAIN